MSKSKKHFVKNAKKNIALDVNTMRLPHWSRMINVLAVTKRNVMHVVDRFTALIVTKSYAILVLIKKHCVA
jgi:hypothetical protein